MGSKEKWRDLDDLGYSRYSISSHGRLLNIEREEFVKGSLKEGYPYAFITDDSGKAKSMQLNLLVANTFVPNPDKLRFITYIDGNKQNIRADNLKWISASDSSKNNRTNKYKGKPVYQLDEDKEIIKKWDSTREAAEYFDIKGEFINGAIRRGTRTQGYYWEYCEKMDGEDEDLEWKEVKVEGYKIIFVSNTGTVKDNKGKIKKQTLNNSGYLNVQIRSEEKYKSKAFRVHILVAKGFLGEHENPKIEINHKDGNKLNNNIKNLEYVTHKENTIHAHKTGLISENRNYKPVIEIDEDKNIIRTFDSCKEAAKVIGVDETAISKVCRGVQRTTKGHILRYA